MTNNQSNYAIIDVTPEAAFGLIHVIVNHYWWTIDNDPTKAIFYRDRHGLYPQCNTARRIVEGLEVPFENATITLIPKAFAPKRG
jgi:hypothetical protein